MEPIIGAFIRPAAPSHQALLLAAVSAVMSPVICKRRPMMMSSPSCVGLISALRCRPPAHQRFRDDLGSESHGISPSRFCDFFLLLFFLPLFSFADHQCKLASFTLFPAALAHILHSDPRGFKPAVDSDPGSDLAP